jgi:hypothetical protein
VVYVAGSEKFLTFLRGKAWGDDSQLFQPLPAGALPVRLKSSRFALLQMFYQDARSLVVSGNPAFLPQFDRFQDGLVEIGKALRKTTSKSARPEDRGLDPALGVATLRFLEDLSGIYHQETSSIRQKGLVLEANLLQVDAAVGAAVARSDYRQLHQLFPDAAKRICGSGCQEDHANVIAFGPYSAGAQILKAIRPDRAGDGLKYTPSFLPHGVADALEARASLAAQFKRFQALEMRLRSLSGGLRGILQLDDEHDMSHVSGRPVTRGPAARILPLTRPRL